MSQNPVGYFKTSPEIIQLGVLMYVRFPLSLRNVEDLLHERGIDACHENVRLWVDRLGTYFAEKIRKRISEAIRRVNQWRRALDEVFKNSPQSIRLCTIISIIRVYRDESRL